MFINFWYPAEEASNVTGQPLPIEIIGMKLVLWRDGDGRVRCIANTCAHRGGSLGHGKIVDGCVQCPYHGWLYDGDGQCRRIPSLGPLNKIPERSRVDAYPVEERYGLVFVFLGDLPAEERPPIMPIPEFGADGWRHVSMRYQWRANYIRLVENQSDPSHVEYVHSGFGFAGKNKDYSVPRITVSESDWGAGAMTEFYSPTLPDQDMSHMSPEGKTDAGSGFHAISSTWTHINFNEQNKMHIYLFACPRDETNLEIFLISLRNCMLEPEKDRNFLERMGIAVEEDRIVIEKLDPQIPDKQTAGEFIVPADDVLMAYRRRIEDWQSRGWRMDVQKILADRGRVAYAIPGPGRRRNPDNWALRPVPLLPATAAESGSGERSWAG